VTVRLTHWRGPLRRAVFVALVAALPPLPVAAASDQAVPAASTAKPKTLQSAVHAAAVRESAVVAAPRAKAAKRADQSGASKQSPGFFRTGAGAVALAVMIVGSGYAIYSASHDKINSAGRK
jgi:hypothetical protein